LKILRQLFEKKKAQISDLIKIRPVAADRHDKADSRFSKFCENAPRNDFSENILCSVLPSKLML
jgi:hypothetical protein